MNKLTAETISTAEVLAETIEMVEPKELRDLLKKAMSQWLDEQITLINK